MKKIGFVRRSRPEGKRGVPVESGRQVRGPNPALPAMGAARIPVDGIPRSSSVHGIDSDPNRRLEKLPRGPLVGQL